ncbi:MAG: peptidase S41 [Pedobacter sp.]|nr:MAG: peptidase S41 [Pedobacter sp.]
MKKTVLLFLLFPVFAFAQSNKISKADKLFGLSKFWQEVNYNFVYLDKVDRPKFDSAYKALLATIGDTKTDYDYYRELQKFCATLKDGHTNVYMPSTGEFETMTTMFGDYRFFVENVGGKAIIVRTNLSKKNEIPLGSEIIEVNGKTTEQYLKDEVEPYIASSTQHVLKNWGINRLLQGRNGDKYLVKIKKPNGNIVSLNLTHQTTAEKEVFPAFEAEQNLFELKWYSNDVAYIALNSFGDEKINKLFLEKLPELYKAKSVIIDLRNNGGGSTSIGRDIIKYFTADSILYGSKSITRLNTSAFKAWGFYTKPEDTAGNSWGKKALLTSQDKFMHEFEYGGFKIGTENKRIVVPTAILIGNNTASAAEDFLIFADNQKHMKKIGEPTFGSTGQPLIFNLPGGGSARVCTKKDTYPDGREFVGYGVIPDIEVARSLNDYLKSNDPVLARALNYLKTAKIN